MGTLDLNMVAKGECRGMCVLWELHVCSLHGWRKDLDVNVAAGVQGYRYCV